MDCTENYNKRYEGEIYWGWKSCCHCRHLFDIINSCAFFISAESFYDDGYIKVNLQWNEWHSGPIDQVGGQYILLATYLVDKSNCLEAEGELYWW